MSSPAVTYAQQAAAKAASAKTVPINQAVKSAEVSSSKLAEKGTNMATPLLGKVTPEKSVMVPPKQKASPPSFKRGGRVSKTGFAKVHKGERVLTRSQAQKRGMR